MPLYMVVYEVLELDCEDDEEQLDEDEEEERNEAVNNEENIINAIKSVGRWHRSMENFWFVHSEIESANELYKKHFENLYKIAKCLYSLIK